MKTNFGIHLQRAISSASMSQLEFERQSGIRQSTTNSIINLGRRPQSITLAAIVGFPWPDNRTRGVSLLVEHLRDEINRSRIRESHPHTQITIRANKTPCAHTDSVLDGLRAHAHASPDVARFLADFLTILDHQDQHNTHRLAAEDHPDYGTEA